MPAIDAILLLLHVYMMQVNHCTSGQTCTLHYGFILAVLTSSLIELLYLCLQF